MEKAEVQKAEVEKEEVEKAEVEKVEMEKASRGGRGQIQQRWPGRGQTPVSGEGLTLG